MGMRGWQHLVWLGLACSGCWSATSSHAGSAASTGHCTPAETVVFDCTTQKGGKHISVCRAPDWSRLTYRYGRPGAVEKAAPEDGDPKKVHHAHVAWARGEEHSLSFPGDGKVRYRVVEAMGGGGPDGALNNYGGVKVEEGGKALAFVECQGAWRGEGLAHAAAHVGASPTP